MKFRVWEEKIKGTHKLKRMRRKNPMKIKKILAATLAATMVMASALTVCAGTTTATSGAGSTGSSSSSSESATVAPKEVKAAGAAIKVAGSDVKTTIAGGYAAKKVEGVAVITPLAEVKANLGLKDGQTPYIIVYDTDAKKSHLAMDCVNAAAEAMGAEFVAAINVDLGAKENGKFIALTDGSIAMVVGIPSVDVTKTYSMVCVQPGGVVTILEDQDTNPKTVTFAVQAGLGTYAIVAN